MKKSLFLKLTIGFLAINILMTSCSKGNVDLIEEEVIEESISSSLRITMDGNTVTYSAFAAYCNANGKEYLQVSNNSQLLGDSMNFTGVQVNDFLFYYIVQGSDTATLGGTALADTPTQGITTLALDADTNANITNIDAVSAEGDFSGQMIIPDFNGGFITVTYSAQFLADIVLGSTFCD